jgi:antibiotic biosynthesis monooxygenase (ABM) superfamily enzyme
MKKLTTILLATLLLAFGASMLTAQNAPTSTAPKSVIHVVTVKWKADTTPEQIQAALDGVKKLPAAYPGITRVWTKSIKVQGGKANAFVMEFADEAALKAYADSPAQKEWYKVYTPIRDESASFDITN